MPTSSRSLEDYGDVLNAQEAATVLRISQRHLRESARRGEIPCRRLGDRMLFPRAALEAWIAGRKPAEE